MGDSTLVKLLAQILADAGVGVWRPDGPDYGPDELAIHYGPLADTPHRGIGITAYLPTDDLENGLAVRRVQLLFRGAPDVPDGADEISDAAFQVLHGRTPSRGLSTIRRISVAQFGADGNRRLERADNYQITLDNPEA